MGVGQLGRSHHLLIGGVQLTEADVVRNGAGEQVGVLQHHRQRPAQVRLLDAAHINAVVGDAPVGHVVEPVNQVGYGGLARAGGAHKGDLLAWLCIKADILQNQAGALVAKAHMLKAHIAPQRGLIAIGLILPDPGPLCTGQLHAALIHLRGLLHGVEDALRACQRRQQKVGLLGELVDGHGRLAHKHQIAGQAAHVGHAVNGHQATQHRHNGVVHIGDAHHGGHHGGRVALGVGGRLAQRLVLGAEGFHILALMVEHLDHLLAADHLLNGAVQLAQHLLLALEIPLAALAAVAHGGEHGNVAQHHHQRELPVQHEQQRQGAHDLDKALDHHGKAVVQRVGNGVHVVGEAAHNVAVAAGIKVTQRQRLHMAEQVPPDFIHDLLGGLHHQLGIAEGGHHAHRIDGRHDAHRRQQAVCIGGQDVAVHQRLEHEGTQQIGGGAQAHQYRNQRHDQLMVAHVGQQYLQGMAQVVGPPGRKLPSAHSSPPPFIWDS